MTSLGVPALQSYSPRQHQLQAVILRDFSYIILLQTDVVQLPFSTACQIGGLLCLECAGQKQKSLDDICFS